jgi:hypothetical protein
VRKRLTVADSYDTLIAEEADKLLDDETVTKAALEAVQENGIVFLDEIDKVTARAETRGADVSREGVQRDLLPLIEGTTVSTKYGPVKTDHILFIASGAFHIAKPSDLLPELQGRLPIRVELRALTEADFVRILTETDNALTRQYSALMGTENVEVTFTEDGIRALAKIAADVNQSVENIGARRLYTVMERVFEELSFTAPTRGGEAVTVDAAFVERIWANCPVRSIPAATFSDLPSPPQIHVIGARAPVAPVRLGHLEDKRAQRPVLSHCGTWWRRTPGRGRHRAVIVPRLSLPGDDQDQPQPPRMGPRRRSGQRRMRVGQRHPVKVDPRLGRQLAARELAVRLAVHRHRRFAQRCGDRPGERRAARPASRPSRRE